MTDIDDRPSPAGTNGLHGRRGFVLTGVGLAGAVAGAPDASAATGGRPQAVPAVSRKAPVPFHGPHQAGILTPQQAFVAFVAFDVVGEDRSGLARVFDVLTKRARALTAGASQGGPDDRLTVTVGVGASLFDERFGLQGRRPAGLRTMPAFPGDDLDPAACHGDLSVQVCAEHPDAVLEVMRDLQLALRGLAAPRWRSDGFLNPPRPSGAPRSIVGFKDGISRPDTASASEIDRVLWLGSRGGAPAWAKGGCYQVLRITRLRVEAWDRLPVSEQERAFGRNKATGAPLTGTKETDAPDYRADPDGRKISFDSHIRRANPRTPETADSLPLRRSYNFDRGLAPDGGLDVGLNFCCYQQDIGRQFEAVQRRLDGERLADFTVTRGGGYFLVLPGVTGAGDTLGASLLKG
ncbi:Dyp-type peroxidase [Streptomyces sp. NBC_00102]|uniref:Dyp-type peroxidase n=1 Tax=Streptomyces sp. NBC_00102 TaxID=2975652 RepID=UPI002257DBF6|nr:Dyp-type peroxidase [Streptomyces sp. NBC_00102]MCX5401473.1 Dyp-type peroxidase [Streptomyces sp. NBC_00102]